MWKLLGLLTFAGVFHVCIGARILAILPVPGKSHHHLFQRLLLELAGRGHQVTYISPFPQPKPVTNFTDITIPNIMMTVMTKTDGEEYNDFTNNPVSSPLYFFVMPSFGLTFMERLLETDVMKEFIKADNEFDLIIGESFWDECILGGLSQKFKAPMVGINTFMANLWSSYMVGNPFPTAYLPEPIIGFSYKMTFVERLFNSVAVFIGEFYHVFFYIPAQDTLMRKYFGDDLPPLQQIIKNVSLVLVNHHRSLGFPRPYLPNMVEIGGFHVSPLKPLPSDIQKLMDEAPHGVILFSMGSILQSSQMPLEMRQIFLNAFSRLKQNVLWKFEDESLANLPKNVNISKWLPQSDILAHPNLRLFITHGGLLSTTEATVRGVPMIGIPVMGDQALNAKQMANSGVGVALNLKTLTEDKLFDAINEVLDNPKYAKNAKLRSELLRDVPMSAIDTAIYWVEYVIRHKGAPHLRSGAQDLAWHELNQLDVIAVVALGVLVVVGVMVYMAKLMCRCLRLVKKTGKTPPEKKTN